MQGRPLSGLAREYRGNNPIRLHQGAALHSLTVI